MKNLKETIDMMVSSDYKDRFKAEYYQNLIRFRKLETLLKQWDNGTLSFTPTCPRDIYTEQLYAMRKYLQILEKRAYIEGVRLKTSTPGEL